MVHAPVQAAADMPEVQEAVVKLCMAWWLAAAPERESVVPQTLPYLLVRALSTGEAWQQHCYDPLQR